MKLVKRNLLEVDVKTFCTTKNQEILDEFVNSDMECAEVMGYTQKTAVSCAGSLTNSIKRFKYHGVKVISRKDKVYLIKVKEK